MQLVDRQERMTKPNQSATELWEQLFSAMAKEETATLVDPEHDTAKDEERLRKGMAAAGWSELQVEALIELHKKREATAPKTSPGANPYVEHRLALLCDDVEAAMSRLGLDSHRRVARGVEPRPGPVAASTNVVMTDEGIITVSSFFFRFCGLVARAFLRTLNLSPSFWESNGYSEFKGRQLILSNPPLAQYWLHIFTSYAVTGTNAIAPYWPSNPYEAFHFEQIARAIEIFAIAHEYGHHHLKHGRKLEGDPKAEEFEADKFALAISWEADQKPFISLNPYMRSGAGGAILLLALKTLQEFKKDFVPKLDASSGTHPAIDARIGRIAAAVNADGREVDRFKRFELAALRIMLCVHAEMSEIRREIPAASRARLEQLADSAWGLP
jgi:hypothetical protein